MKVTIFGTGYVGLVTGACLAEMGNHVVCVDIDAGKVDRLKRGEIPIYEPGLEAIVQSNHAGGRLDFTTEAAPAIAHGELIFIAVGTPPDEDGSADLQYVQKVAGTIGRHLQRYAVVVNKSTVPVGTADRVREAIAAELAVRQATVEFDVVSNPEFLKEGAAVEDCLRPDRIVVGTSSTRAVALLRKLYAPFNRNHDRMVVMDERSAELTKYAANAMLATKISFMNEIANIAERVGADVELVRQGIGSDPRIGYSFIYPGAGYGGSCFPKDVQALERTAHAHGYEARLLGAVEAVNRQQKGKLFELISRHFDGRLAGRTIALWGLAFKPNTDDMREASSRRLMEQLWEAGAKVRAFDPEARGEAQRLYGDRDDLVLCEHAMDALQGADVLAVVTEWKAFRSPDFRAIRATLAVPAIFDGRNLYDPLVVEEAGLAYYGIGRGRSLQVSR
ncbi:MULTISPECIES: UDP-glucose dehydrogenase family protein [Rhodanobacter]|uniref:UDP-glucose dehydrogenase family protein n=1 Tax=Rhodanobacter TaxID=75309 RepID=UPI000486968F|nr:MULTISPECIES: UDP-glucose/GDP-mannose dehydrogenase family protein [Rhodanobacter]KZC20567.1 UDP-glucose 6-dehydrogenase [Rhodanobacter denitrificans]UJJ52878.1 UDP-glucose/GDP-mannose dehydrogenase family protein [Rhodanobacter denitrificans]UJJ60370.1 UDP-glucose/GDP-mannose dehydrogenase family protein [Rhodanobacter denitrificans]UJM95632.1 UDP-glucose/GDP-mannose dehydrogenase family protein [Rhodanobacter denitrificans]UJM99162.1 UDP-glucose/GDP-mannose dehydrogenase family protein [R